MFYTHLSSSVSVFLLFSFFLLYFSICLYIFHLTYNLICYINVIHFIVVSRMFVTMGLLYTYAVRFNAALHPIYFLNWYYTYTLIFWISYDGTSMFDSLFHPIIFYIYNLILEFFSAKGLKYLFFIRQRQ